ncbi:MAG: response regulator [Candidatus Korobacteraceae bacterium]
MQEDTQSVVLVVEDDDSVRAVTCEILRTEGYRVLQATDASEGLALIRREGGRVNLTITDVVLPEVNGVEFAKQVRKLYPAIPILLVSGYLEDVLSQYPGDTYGLSTMEKPFTVGQLRTFVRECLDRPHHVA